MRSCQRCLYFLCGLTVCVVAAGIAAVGLLVGATFLFRPRWRHCSRVTCLPLQRREERVCLCSASSINMNIFTRVTRFVTLRNLSVSHELLVTSSESVGVTTGINSAGSPSAIRRCSDQKCKVYSCHLPVTRITLPSFSFCSSVVQGSFASSVVPGSTLRLLET